MTKTIPRSWLIPSILIGFVLTFAILSQLAPKWIQGVGLDVWNAPKLNEQIKADASKDREMTMSLEKWKRRCLLKGQIIDSLLDGKISLQEATAQFFTLNQSLPKTMMDIRTHYKGETDLEKMARNVLAFATHQMRGSPAEKAALFARLKNEFQQLTGATFDGTYDAN